MSYIIDGHNLIPRIPGMSLSDLDDETELIDRLQAFCQARNKTAEVYFDRAPTGHGGQRSFGRIKAHFIRHEQTADQAIIRRLQTLGKSAKNWTLVTSDRQVQAEGRSRGLKIVSSEEFARLLAAAQASSAPDAPGQPAVNDPDIDEWLRLFNEAKPDNT